MLTKNCELCGKDYEARVSYQIYCGPTVCRTEATKEKNNSKQRRQENQISCR